MQKTHPRRDSNPQSLDPESNALTIALPGQKIYYKCINLKINYLLVLYLTVINL
jgi:hypothetical protein